MEDDRSARVEAAINELARAEGTAVAVRHVCLACAHALGAGGVGLFVVGDLGIGEPVYATDATSELVGELQVTLGEGPVVETLEDDRLVLVPDLTRGATLRRWPVFAQAAIEAGAHAVFTFPLTMGAISAGALQVYRPRRGNLATIELADALLYADAAMLLLVDRVGTTPSEDEAELFAGGYSANWVQVHQATGVVSVQLDIDLTEAFLRLRAHAFLTDRRLSEVARDVVEGVLRLEQG